MLKEGWALAGQLDSWQEGLPGQLCRVRATSTWRLVKVLGWAWGPREGFLFSPRASVLSYELPRSSTLISLQVKLSLLFQLELGLVSGEGTGIALGPPNDGKG